MSTASLPWAGLTLPVAHHRQFAKNRCWSEKTLGDLAYDQVQADPAFFSFVAGTTTASRAQILSDAEALAVGLTDLGLCKGDVVSFQVPNWIEAAVVNLACALAGFVINPIVPIYRDAEVGMMLGDCKAKVFI